MNTTSHLNSLYGGSQIVLWVEDTATSAYLAEIWANPLEISFLSAGGNSSIRPAVEAARQSGIRHVFGVVDRDFGRSNRDRWRNHDASSLFYLPRHEIENYALDTRAIEGCYLNNRQRSSADIEDEMRRLADLQLNWLACRKVLTTIRDGIHKNYPEHPKVADIQSIEAAEQHIVDSDWLKQLPTASSSWTTSGAVRRALQNAVNHYQTDLGNGNWTINFSGKEIFRQIRSYVYQPPQNPGIPDVDFIKAIGAWQYENQQVPGDLVELRQALYSRVNLSWNPT